MTREQEITASVDSLLAEWINGRSLSPKSLKVYRREIARFAEWAAFYGLAPPATGHVVAGYLLELAADGAPLSALRRAARAIKFYYGLRRSYLDPMPIDAALALVAAQLSQDRVLN